MKSIISSILFSIAFLVLGCSSSEKEPLIKDNNLTAVSGQEVDIQANGALSYLWKQTSGVDVVLVDANTATLKFMAPEVQKQELLTFELTASLSKHVESLVKEQVFVTVIPLQQEDLNSSNETNTTQAIRSLQLTLGKTSLNIDTNTTLSVIATYDDNTTKDVTNEVEWSYTDNLAITIQNHTLKTNHKDTNIFLQAKYNNKLSNQVALEIYKEINGHRLPPEPNATINNATLLGVDINNNGVRDDVERKIYAVYKRPVEQAYMMQDAKIYPQTLEDPIAAAKSEELEKEHWNVYSCNGYLNHELNIIIPRNNVGFMENAYFNTKERMRAYIEFNEASSGGVYSIPLPRDDNKENCDFNVTKMLEME